MINITLDGGLGNQMFQYALGRSFSSRGKEVTYDRTRLVDRSNAPHHRDRPQYGLDGFDIEVPFGPPVGKVFSDYDFPGALPYRPEVWDQLEPVTFRGHWQCEKYFPEQLRSEDFAVITGGLSDSAREVWSKVIYRYPTVFIHVRRGDYTLPVNVPYHGLLDEDYYTAALRYMLERVADLHVLVFSDDPDWCDVNFPLDHVVRGNSQFEDLWLMSQCKHAIIANSTFSWWGAWLGDKQVDRIVIGPKNWFATPKLDSRDILPERWMKL